MNKYYIHDARKCDDLFSTPNVDLIITSPPYYNLKDYGSENQIGFQQSYEEYLKDLELVFGKCFKITKKNASLWIVIDNIRKDNNFKLLSFELINLVSKSGWNLQDIIIWKKDRTIPFTHKGEMRNIFEYVLFFTKGKDYKYYPDRITSIQNLKEWWQKYPERYSPKGVLPTNIWDFPIPIQGSWGNNYIRHFCPLPEGLIKRIILLCTDINDVVFDPFAGTGSVLSVAYKLKRNYIGSDLNNEFKQKFLQYLRTINVESNIESDITFNQLEEFSNTITKLRILKFPKTLYKLLLKSKNKYIGSIKYILAQSSDGNLKRVAEKKLNCKYILVTDNKFTNMEKLIDDSLVLTKKIPLSKFGIKAEIKAVSEKDAIKYFKDTSLWCYYDGKTHLPPQKVKLQDIYSNKNKDSVPPIYSSIRIVKEELKW